MLRRNTNYIIFSFLLDWAVVLLAAAATWLRSKLPFGPLTRTLVLHTPVGSVLPLPGNLYAIFALRPERTYRAVDEYQILSIASFLAALALAGLAFIAAHDASRLTLLYFYGIHFSMVTSWRAVVRLIRRSSHSNGQNLRRVLLVGGGEAAQRALDRLEELAWAGVYLVGYLTDGDQFPVPMKISRCWER
jgi:FlaA1/EpsC-like NDP-sugar epimerase